jgi:acetyltransferase (fragment)
MQRMIDDSEDMDGAMYVAEENGQVVGFIQGVIIDHQPGQDAVFDAVHIPRKDGWIGLLYVEPEQRGSGIGRALLDEMKHYFQSKNCDTLRLKVLSGNQRAIAFYEKYGLTAREVEMITKLR